MQLDTASGIPRYPEVQRRSGLRPALVLFFIAPLVSEVLAGSTPLDLMGNPAIFLIVFLLEALLYGSGAILIREIARRAGRGWLAILGLGLAFGVLEEGLITESFFNPDYLGLHLLGLGNLFGLGWVWITDVLALHMFWSIGVSIALVEVLFRQRCTDPWLGPVGLLFVSALFVAGVVGIGYGTYMNNHHFLAPWPKLAGALIVVLVVAALALRLPKRQVAVSMPTGRAPSPWLVGAAAFVGASIFVCVHQLYNVVPTLPGILPVAVTVAVAAAVLLMVWRWSAQPGWGLPHQLALTAGALFTYAWNGFVTIPLSDGIDVAGQIAIDTLAVALVIVVALSLARNGAQTTGDGPM